MAARWSIRTRPTIGTVQRSTRTPHDQPALHERGNQHRAAHVDLRLLMSRPMPAAVADIRREICGRCAAQCAAFLSGELNHGDPAARCPRSGWPQAWGAYGRGLGDAVAYIAQPIVGMI